MPLTFIDIERQKNWRIGVFFLVLLFLYFCVIALLAAPLLGFPLNAAPRFWIAAGLIALVVSGIHFFFAAYTSVDAVTRSLNAEPPDPRDNVHKMLRNVVEELHVVTGQKRKMRCVVVPSLSMNALAVADLTGEAVIGITEGLLSRLSRPQLETVIAHEAHHILSGDCLETTVAASLFGTLASAVEKLGEATRGRAFSSPAFLLAWLLLKLSHLLNLFISREREYRADAAAVRMTRNPVALAETLHLLSRSWRGAGFIGSGFEMLCIVNPRASALDETEGFRADLLSTHPPLARRMEILLTMARVSVSELDAKAANKKAAAERTGEGRYYAMDPRQLWQGPFTLAELGLLPWLSPLTWIAQNREQPLVRAWKDPSVNTVFSARLREKPASRHVCPVCGQPLVTETYEGTQTAACRYCGGVLVESAKIPRIIARTGRERPCSERILQIAKTVVNENQARHTRRKLAGGSLAAIPLLACPQCGNPMHRGFYSLGHLVEIDRCGMCGLTWFEQDELQMLQCLIENKIVPEIAEGEGTRGVEGWSVNR